MATIEKRELSGGALSYRARVRIKGHPQQIATFERLALGTADGGRNS